MCTSAYFYGCKKCGNIVMLINDGFGSLKCCGETMSLLKSNVSHINDKMHIPCISKDNGLIHIKIGETEHPMLDIHHHIEWIAVASNGLYEMKYLHVDDSPKAVFPYNGPGKVYCFCNVHGLWEAEFN